MGSRSVTFPTSPDDIEKELLKLAHSTQIDEAIQILRILPRGHKPFRIEVTVPWYRSGAETYLARFRVLTDGVDDYELVLKACVPSSIAVPIDQVLGSWVRRRESLSNLFGVSFVPKLFGYGEGVLLEEFIPLEISEKQVRDLSFVDLFSKSLTRLRLLGYNCKTLLHDFRTRGTDLVLVDFGEDLGESDGNLGADYTEQFVEYLKKLGAPPEICAHARSKIAIPGNNSRH